VHEHKIEQAKRPFYPEKCGKVDGMLLDRPGLQSQAKKAKRDFSLRSK
jgi:hypothetical protein